MTDKECKLVIQARQGDRDAYGALIDAYQGMVFAVALNLTGDWHDSEEVVQDTFLTAWEKLRTLADPARFTSWLYTIARRIALELLRRKNHLTMIDFESELTRQAPLDADSPAETYARRQLQKILWEELAALPARTREALLLFYIEDYTIRRAAEFVGCSDAAFKMRLQYGRERLREALAEKLGLELKRRQPGEEKRNAILAALPTLPRILATPGKNAPASAGAIMTGASAWLATWTRKQIALLTAALLASTLIGAMLLKQYADARGSHAFRVQSAHVRKEGFAAASKSNASITSSNLAGANTSAAVALHPARPGYLLRGQVLDYQTGNPIPGVRPVLDDQSTNQATLDPQGRWLFARVPMGRHKLTFSKDDPALTNYVIECTFNKGLSLDLWVDRPVEELRVYLQPRPWRSGRVVDQQGRPVAGARIVSDTMTRPRNPFPPLCVSDAQGRFRYAERSLNTIGFKIIRADAPGFFSSRLKVSQADYNQTPDELEITLVRQERGGVVSGRILSADGQPLPQFPMILRLLASPRPGPDISYWLDLKTNFDGTFRIERVPPGHLLLLAAGGSFAKNLLRQEFELLPKGAAAGIELISLLPLSGGSISGRLTFEDRQPAPGELISAIIVPPSAKVDDSVPGQSALTDADGRFSMGSLPPGKRVNLYLDTRNLTYVEPPTIQIAADVQVSTSGLELIIPSSETLYGKRPAWNPNAPVPRVRPPRLVDSVDWSDRSGPRFHALVVAGHACLAVNEKGIMTVDQSARLTACKSVIEGRVVNEHGQPVSHAEVAIQDGDQICRSQPSDEQGRFRLVRTFSGGSMTVKRAGYIVKALPQIPWHNADPRQECVVVLARDPGYSMGEIVGVTLDSQGRPLPDAMIVLSPLRSGQAPGTRAPAAYGKVFDAMGMPMRETREPKTMSDRQGIFSFTSVQAGEYTIRLQDERGALQKISVRPDQVCEVTIQQGGALLSGRVTNHGSIVENPAIYLGREGVSEKFRSEEALKANEGRFSFEKLAPGRWLLSIAVGEPTFYHVLPVELSANAKVEKDIELQTSTIEGAVCGHGGNPPPRSLVWLLTPYTLGSQSLLHALRAYLQPAGGFGSTVGEGMIFPGPDGRFRFSGVPEGNYQIVAAAPEGGVTSTDLKVRGGQPMTGIRLELPQAAIPQERKF